jgi:uncharacterized protein
VVRLVADSNIWISAFNFSGNPRRVIELGASELVQIATSDAILQEVWRVQHEKFELAMEQLEEWQKDILEFTLHVKPTETLDVVKDDADDNRVIECAVGARADYIVTGDNDLLRLRTFRNVAIVSPAEFLKQTSA